MPQSYALQSIVAIAAAIILFQQCAHAASCPVSTCDPSDQNLPRTWLNTSTSAYYINGLSFTVYPMQRDGKAFLETYAYFGIYGVQELQPFTPGVCDYNYPYPSVSGLAATVLNEFDWSAHCCELSTSWDMLAPTVNRTTVTVIVTNPLYADFVMSMSMYLVNESITYSHAGTPNTANVSWETTYQYVIILPAALISSARRD